MSFFIQNSLPLLAVRDNVALKQTAVALHFRTEASSTFKNITVFSHDTALVFFKSLQEYLFPLTKKVFTKFDFYDFNTFSIFLENNIFCIGRFYFKVLKR